MGGSSGVEKERRWREHGGPTSHLSTPKAQGPLLGKLAPPVTQAENQRQCLPDISGTPLMDGI